MTDEELKEFIRDTINSVVKDRFDLLIRKIESVQTSVDNLIEDTDEDRKDFAEIKIGMSAILRSQKEIVDTRKEQSKRIVEGVKSQVEETVAQVTAELSEQFEPVVQKAFLNTHLGVPFKKRNKLLDKLLFWRKNARRT